MNEVELERLVVRLTGDASSYTKMLGTATQQTKQATAAIEGSVNQASSGMSFGLRRFALQAMGALAPLMGAFSILGGAFKGVQLAAEAEQAAVTFEVLLRNASAAKQRIEELSKFAAETPFALPEIVSASKMLQTFGGSMLATGKSLTMVGDMASAAGAPFQEVAVWVGRAYSAIQSGRPFGEAAARLQELGLLSGQERNSLESLQHSGASAAAQWQNFERVMSRFGGTMQKQSQTVSGLFSTMGDDINATLREIGENLISLLRLKDLMKGISAAAQHVTETIKAMPPELKAMVAMLAAVTAAAATLALAGPMLKSVFWASLKYLVVGLDILLGPINLIGIAIVAVAALWVASVGGIDNAMGILKDTAMFFVDFVKENWKTLLIVIGATTGPLGWIALAITAIIQNSGGLSAVWNRLKSTGAGVWQAIRERIFNFVVWATPYVQQFLVRAHRAWMVFRGVVAVVWDAITAKVRGFIAWAQPKVNTLTTWIGNAWEKVSTAAGIAWDWIKTKVMAFVEWIRPIALAYVGYLSAAWDLAMYAAEKAWDFTVDVAVKAWDFITDAASGFGKFIGDLWRSIVGDTSTDWKSVQDFIVDALIAAEFGLRNFGKVAEHIWTGIKIGFYSFTGEIEHFFKSTLPVLGSWFGRNWSNIFKDAFSFTIGATVKMGENIVSIIKNLPGLIAGTTAFKDVWKPLTEGFESTIQALPQIPARQASALERELLREFEQQAAALSMSFREFRAQRLKEIAMFRFGIPADQMEAAMRAAANQAEQGGQQVGEAFNEGAASEVKKMDAVLRSSAEALTRIQEYADARALERQGRGTQGAGAVGGAGGMASPVPVSSPLAPMQTAPPPASDNRLIVELLAAANGQRQHLVELVQRQLNAASAPQIATI